MRRGQAADEQPLCVSSPRLTPCLPTCFCIFPNSRPHLVRKAGFRRGGIHCPVCFYRLNLTCSSYSTLIAEAGFNTLIRYIPAISGVRQHLVYCIKILISCWSWSGCLSTETATRIRIVCWKDIWLMLTRLTQLVHCYCFSLMSLRLISKASFDDNANL